jgi:hypothetical protein
LLLALARAVISGAKSRGTRAIFYCLRFETSFFVVSYYSRVMVEVFNPWF